ncbi:hypothetical protein VUR80DRAFT_5943 [Thermomyces stellatus]
MPSIKIWLLSGLSGRRACSWREGFALDPTRQPPLTGGSLPRISGPLPTQKKNVRLRNRRCCCRRARRRAVYRGHLPRSPGTAKTSQPSSKKWASDPLSPSDRSQLLTQASKVENPAEIFAKSGPFWTAVSRRRSTCTAFSRPGSRGERSVRARHRKLLISASGKAKQVEQLVTAILKDVQELAADRVFRDGDRGPDGGTENSDRRPGSTPA